MRIQLFICCHPHELLQGSAANSIVRGEETRNQLQKLGTEQGICFGPAHFRGGSHKNETAKVVLPIVAEVVEEELAAIKPTCPYRHGERQTAAFPLGHVYSPFFILQSCLLPTPFRGTITPPHP